MSKWIEIRFNGPYDPDGSLNIHRIRNFAEHLSCTLSDLRFGKLPMDDADRTVDKILISGIRTRMLHRAISHLKQQIVAHGFSGDATITVGAETED